MKLKPCPFCGNEDVVLDGSLTNYLPSFASVKCEKCDAEVTYYSNGFKEDKRFSYEKLERSKDLYAKKVDREAIKKWNRRSLKHI